MTLVQGCGKAFLLWPNAVLRHLDDGDNVAVMQLTTYIGCLANLERGAGPHVLRNCIIWTCAEMSHIKLESSHASKPYIRLRQIQGCGLTFSIT